MAGSISIVVGKKSSGGGGGGSVNTGVLQISGGVALDTTLRAVTDQANTASPLQLSTTQVLVNSKLTINNTLEGSTSGRMNIVAQYDLALVAGNSASGVGGVFVGGSSVAPTARLHVRGDGTNPVARFEDNSGLVTLRVDNSLIRFGGSTAFGSLAYAMTGTTFSGNNNGTGLGFYSQFSIAGSSDRYDFGFGGDAVANTAGSVTHLAISRNFAAGAGSANFRPFGIYYTINNSGAQTGIATGIYLDATETALNSMTHNLIDLQIGGVSRFKVGRDGIIQTYAAEMLFGTGSRLMTDGNGTFRLSNFDKNNFSLLLLGGTTNAFPAIKRNGAAIDFRLADDSNYANFNAGTIVSYSGATYVQITPTEIVNDGNIDLSISNASTTKSIIFKTNTGAGRVEVGRFSSTGAFSTQSTITSGSDINMSGNLIRFSRGRINFYGTDGDITLTNSTENGFGLLKFGGLTTAFPAIKRSSAELQIRLADDSGYANLRANAIYTEGGLISKDNTSLSGAGDGRISFKSWNNMILNLSDNGVAVRDNNYTANVASSILELTSTTKGFLPPRMTTTQRDNIATPAEGLVIYNTTTQVLNFYNGSAWGAV